MKITKRLISLIIALSLVFTMGLSAFAEGEEITGLEATLSGNTVTVRGYTTDVKAAVFVQLREGDNVLASGTFNVGEAGFSGTLSPDDNTTLDANTTYTVWAADIDGGLWATATVNASAASVLGYMLRLDGTLGVDYYVKLDDSLANNDTTITFTMDSVEKDLKTQAVKFADADYDSTKEAYVFPCGVASGEMTVPVTATLTNGDTTIVFDEFTVRDYARALIAMNIDETTSDLAKALLSYGYYSQVKFGVGGDKFEEDKVEFVDSTPASKTVNIDIDGIDYYGSSIAFLSGARLRQYYTITAPQTTFYINDEETTVTRNIGRYYIQTEEIPVNRVDVPVWIKVSDGVNEYEYSFAPLNYLGAVLESDTVGQEMKDLAMAYFTYYKAAQTYYDAHH